MIRKIPAFALSFLFLPLILFIASVPASARQRGRAASRSSRRESGRAARGSRRDRRESLREERAARDDRQGGRNGRRMSRRDRLEEARRRREEERRRREEIARREAARRAALARQRAFDQSLRDQAAQNIAKDETLAEDMEVRRVAINALAGRAGTVVVMNPMSGQIYAVVNQEWGLRRGYKPCSTVKLVTGLAGLGEKIISPVEAVNVSASGGYQLDLTEALAYSNNAYFQHVGGQVGFDKIVSYARDLGLGAKTGVNYPNEYAGALPYGKYGYAVNHMCSHGDDFEVTPIQLATLVSAMANGGKLLLPHLPRTVDENTNFKTEVRRKLNIPKENLQRMLPGMIGAVNFGTARRAYDPAYTIAGKTGTCIGQGSWLGLFASYAPVGDPRLAIVVVTRGSHERSKYAAEVAGSIYRQLAVRFGLNKVKSPLSVEVRAQREKLDAATAAAVSDEEKDEEGDAMAGGAETEKTDGKAVDAKKTAPNKPGKILKPVVMPVPRTQSSDNANEKKSQQSTVQTNVNSPTPPTNDATGQDARPRRTTTKKP